MQRIIPLLCIATLTACSSPYGNYAKVTDTYNGQMADDAARELAALYPPASTHLLLSQETKDAYGVELIKKLRESGYGIEDGSLLDAPSAPTGSNDAQHNTALPKTAVKPETPAAATGAGKAFGYIVDKIGDGLYRVTLRIDAKIVSRVYMVSGSEMVSAGAWTRKE